MDREIFAVLWITIVIVLPTLLMIAWFVRPDKHEKEREIKKARKKEQKRLKKQGLANSHS